MNSCTSTSKTQAELSYDSVAGQYEGTQPHLPPPVALHNLHAPDARTSGNDPTLTRSIAADPGHIEAHAQAGITESRGAQRKRCALIAGAGSACVLITGLAMKSAGCTYTEIQWPITTVVVITGMFLTPAYANSIA